MKYFILLAVVGGVLAVPRTAKAQRNWSEYKAWCESQNGIAYPNPPRCVPPATTGTSDRGESSADANAGEAAGRRARGWIDCKFFRKNCPEKSDSRQEDAFALNHQGIEAFKREDWATAASYFEQALIKSPDDPVIKQNVANARSWLAHKEANEKKEREVAEARRRNKATADNMQQSMQNFAKTLNAAPSSGGLDFDAGGSTNPANGGTKSGKLDFTSGDTKVVDARKVPSGLPKSLDDAIAVAYRGASPEVIQRVRHGFEAVMNRDWPLAKAYFEDALNRDPDNVNLKTLAKLSDSDLRASMLKRSSASDVQMKSRGVSYPPIPPTYMLDRDGRPIQLPIDYQGGIQRYEKRKDGTLVELPRITRMFLDPPASIVLSDIPTYRMDKAGNLIEVPYDYDGRDETYRRGKDGQLLQMPKPSDVTFLFPGIAGHAPTQGSAPKSKTRKH